MKKLLWSPPKDRINNSNLKKFIEFVKLENCNDFKTLWKWSISNPEKFWSKFSEKKCFFQFPFRTWGMNLDTIACLFELVDGL